MVMMGMCVVGEARCKAGTLVDRHQDALSLSHTVGAKFQQRVGTCKLRAYIVYILCTLSVIKICIITNITVVSNAHLCTAFQRMCVDVRIIKIVGISFC